MVCFEALEQLQATTRGVPFHIPLCCPLVADTFARFAGPLQKQRQLVTAPTLNIKIIVTMIDRIGLGGRDIATMPKAVGQQRALDSGYVFICDDNGPMAVTTMHVNIFAAQYAEEARMFGRQHGPGAISGRAASQGDKEFRLSVAVKVKSERTIAISRRSVVVSM